MRVFTTVPNGGSDGAATTANEQLLPVDFVDDIPVQRVQPVQARRWRGGQTYERLLVDYCRDPGNRPDLVQFLSLPSWPLPWLMFLRRLRIPLVLTHTLLGEMSDRLWKRGVQRLLWRLPFQMVDRVVVSSGVMRDAVRGLGVTTGIEVIPNGVDLDRFRPVASEFERTVLRQQLSLDPDADVILFVGPINARKGINELIGAWNRLEQMRPRATLVLVGPGYDVGIRSQSNSDLQADIEAAFSKSSGRNRVVFTGTVKNPERYFQAADVFVFPSRREGLPNVVLEAFGCGVASVLTPFIGLPDEIGRPGEEYLLVERTPEALAAAIDNLLDHPERRIQLGRQARQWVQGRMDLQHSVDRYAALYRDLVGRANTTQGLAAR